MTNRIETTNFDAWLKVPEVSSYQKSSMDDEDSILSHDVIVSLWRDACGRHDAIQQRAQKRVDVEAKRKENLQMDIQQTMANRIREETEEAKRRQIEEEERKAAMARELERKRQQEKEERERAMQTVDMDAQQQMMQDNDDDYGGFM